MVLGRLRVLTICCGISASGCGRVGFASIADAASGGDPASGDAAGNDACTTPAPRAWAIPNGGAYATMFASELGSDPQTATIYYTLDGTAPSSNSPSAVGTVAVTYMPGTPVQFFAASGCALQMPEGSETYTIDTAAQSATDFLASGLSLAGSSPVAIVSASAPVTLQGTFEEWARTGCPNCIVQTVVGIESTPAGCALDTVPGTWPGATITTSIAMTVPATPGTYFVYGYVTGQTSCANAFPVYTSNAVAGNRKLGVLVVQ